MVKEKSVPWSKWEFLSKKGHARDTIFSDCGHTFFVVPYTIEFLVKSKISILKLKCSAPACKAVDEYLTETDTNHISKINPPNVRAVNKKAAYVVNQMGVLQGPFTFQEWKLYSWKYWYWFHDIVGDPVLFNHQSKTNWWAKIYFRDMTQFVAGNYNYYSDLHLLMVRKIVDLETRHRCYASMHSGVDLYHNLKPIDITEAKSFHNKGKIFNISAPHISNHKIRGKNPAETNLITERQCRQNHFERFKYKKDSDSDLLSRAIADDTNEQYFEAWYPLTKQVPFRITRQNNVNSVTPAHFENNQHHIEMHLAKIIKCLTGFITTGALRLMPKSYRPIMTAALVLANATHPTKKVRPCFDGGPLKLTAAFKIPCKLEGLPQIFTLLAADYKVTKTDDTQGFHLVALHPESRDLCVFEFLGRHLQYVGLPFGQSEAPGEFQQANQIPLLYASEYGIPVTCYLDDRLVSEPAELKINGIEIDPNLGRNSFLVTLLILASGGFINMIKSNFDPVFQDEFLGMNIDTTTCTVSVPDRKIKDLKDRLKGFEQRTHITLEEAEITRGIQASFLIASRHLKMFIRAQTIAIENCKRKHPGEIHHFYKSDKIKITPELRAEWAEWQKATILELTRCWLPPVETGTPVFFLHTDASLGQWGAVLFEGEIEIGEIALPFSESQSDWTIVQKEILAIFFALVHFAEKVRNSTVLLYCDNQQAVYSFISDGSRVPRVNEILIDIYRLAKILNIDIPIAWIPTHLQIGDEPSRIIDLNEEFLPQMYFDTISEALPFTPEVDAMASIANTKCSKFITRGHLKLPMPGRIATDFLNITPDKIGFPNLYIFPPKVILDKVCRHLSKFYKKTNFVLIFHQFFELPIGIETLLQMPNTNIFTISHKKALTYIPSEKDSKLETKNGKSQTIKGSPNIRPRAIRMLVHLK